MSTEKLQGDAARLLLACIRTPWSSIAALAATLGMAESRAADLCRSLLARGWVQQAEFALSHFPRAVFAPTDAGLAICQISAEALRLRMGLTAERFWALRAGFEVAAETNALCAASVADWPSGGEWQTFVQRRYHKRPLFLHARLVLWDGDEARAFYILNDRGEMPALRWTGYIRYLAQWARRSGGCFPPLLIVSTRRFRAWAMLALARMVAGETLGEAAGEGSPRGSLIALATAERALTIRGGIAAVAKQSGWLALTANNALISVNPLALPACARDIFERSPHAIEKLPEPSKKGARTPPPMLPARPPEMAGLERLETLDDSAWRAFGVVCRAPLCPTDFVAAMLGADEAATAHALETLRARGLVAPAEIQTRYALPLLWTVTDDGLRLRALRELRIPEDAETHRYRFFAADHARRPGHTLAAYRLASRLARDCAARAWATRPMDNGAPYYEWGVFEPEARAAQVYAVDGVGRIFRSDGYGALRAGTAWTRFFIEIDGWLGENGAAGQRSRADAGVWQDKFGRLCDYQRSLWWTFRYPRFPRVLIVTTDMRNLGLAHNALIIAARARRMEAPQVYMADAREVAEVGPLNRIWHSVNAGLLEQERCFAFEQAEQPGIVVGEGASRRTDLIRDMQRAVDIGILGLPQPIRRSSARSVGQRNEQLA
ncbi:MAG: hypothetical protein ACUVSX_16345 [Aggregatilineales bacterium]